ncbi:UDP-glycosyltransferase 75C1 [Spatholobus suberectus]|nr:UDP-glycosyltransferase 75C1 [Spatholobus suberectus]
MFRHRFLLVLYPAQGHINPAFQFAKRLVGLGAHVTVSTTLHMHRRITDKPTLPAISFLPFSDGYDDGLPLLLAPRDLPSFLLGLNPTFDSLAVSKFEEQLRDLDFLCVIQDANGGTGTCVIRLWTSFLVGH